MKWTKEQSEAINTTGVNITVSASAGAGKTAVLVQRLMKRIIEDKISVDKIVALTFTEAAAAEMKNRLMSELSKRFLDNPQDLYLKDQITLLPSAKISTIHSFCLSILKDYYYVLQIDPSSLNNILDQATIAQVKSSAFDHVINHYDQKALEDTLYNLSSSAMNTDSLKDIILNVSEASFAQPDANSWLDNSIVMYNDFSSLDKLPENFKILFWDYIQTTTNQLSDTVFKLDRVIDSLKDQVDVVTQTQWVRGIIIQLHFIKDAIKNRDYQKYHLCLEKIASIKHKNIPKQPDFKDARDKYFTILNSILEILYPEKVLLEDLSHNKDLAKNIIEIVKMYNREYTKDIQAENGITFNDMEILTYQLLTKNNNEVALVIQDEIEDILIDEFQDTNLLQNQIIDLVGRNNNIFRVGDVKQSIYRFRGAKPSLMQELIQTGNTENHKTIFLSNNFRSKKAIVEYNNHLFKQLMNTKTFDSSYTAADTVTAGTENQNIDSKPVELHLVNTEQEAYSDLDDDYNLTGHQFRSEYIANQIVKLYKEDIEKKWNKFTVLVESHKNKEYLRQAFDKANIPYFIAMSDGFYDSYGVSTILAYLKLVLNPKDSISLTAILINLYGYSENEISKLFLIHKDMFKATDTIDRNILKRIHHYHLNQNRTKLTDIINYAMSVNNFYEEKISNQSRTNLDLFYESAVAYQESQSGIYGFILEIETMQKEKTSEASSISSEDNVVNVMTIHNSKGLQFDTVFLYSKSANRNMDSTSNFVIHPDLGLALKTTYTEKRIIKDNLANFLIRYYDYKEALEEEMRKLYVSLTRAQNRLFIVDTFKVNNDKEYLSFDYNDVYNSIGYTGWINAVSQNFYCNDLVVEKAESFEYKAVPPKRKELKQISKNNEINKPKVKESYKWPIKPLNLSIDEVHFDIGSSIHNTIEKLPTTKWNSEMIREINPNISDHFIEKLMQLSSNPFFRELSTYQVLKEYPFISNLDNKYQRGIIDYLAISDKEVYIVDFKTDLVESGDQLIERYSDQLDFYKKAITSKFKDKKISSHIYSIHLDKFIKI